jgi:hypothetical protein
MHKIIVTVKVAHTGMGMWRAVGSTYAVERSYAKILRAIGKVDYNDAVAPSASDAVIYPSSGELASVDALRDEYERISGKEADKRWKAPRLAAAIAEIGANTPELDVGEKQGEEN